MATLFCSLDIKADKLGEWERIITKLVNATREHEPDCLRYEYYRSSKDNRYYVLLSFHGATEFYEHQGADYHNRYFAEAMSFIEDLALEWIDPIRNGGSGLPSTYIQPISENASAQAKAEVSKCPIVVQQWWDTLR